MKPCTSCADSYLAAAEEPVCIETIRRCSLPPQTWPRSLLDVGAGTSGAGARIAGALGIPYVGIDKGSERPLGQTYWGGGESRTPTNPHVRLLTPVETFESDPFDVVLLKRVLCQTQTWDELRGVSVAAERLTAPGGLLVVCEPWLSHAPHPLPESTTSPSRPVPEGQFPGWECVSDQPVAPGYVVWTRDTNRCRLAYDDPRRYLFPAGLVEHYHAFYRVRAYRRDS